MMFKKSKNDLLMSIRDKAQSSANMAIYNSYNVNNLVQFDKNNLATLISDAVSQAMEASFKELIEQIYTDAEFEEDIKLR